MKLLRNAFIAAFISTSALIAFGQESQEKVVDEVVAVINNDVITLSRVKREIKFIIDSEVQNGKDRAAAEKAVSEKYGELIANLINEELMVQRAKEVGIDKDADAEVNQRFAEIMKQYNMKTLDSLYKAMEQQGVNPQEMREMWRKQAIRELVLQRDLQSTVYWKPTAQQVKEYFEKNKSKFTKPETITLSEIYLSYAGRDENAVKEKAKQLVAQIRAGADFVKLAVENSDRQNVATTKGKVDTFEIGQLEKADAQVAAAVKSLKPGGVTDPMNAEDVGVVIYRVDEHATASTESFFDERKVRMAMLGETFPSAQKEYMAKLRDNAYIKISESYRPLVSPILFQEERKQKAAN